MTHKLYLNFPKSIKIKETETETKGVGGSRGTKGGKTSDAMGRRPRISP